MADERCKDECLTGIHRFKTETFITVLDEANQQMSSRFEQQNLVFMKQLTMFTPKNLLSDHCINASDIDAICNQYGVDSAIVVAELSDFRRTYRLLCDGDEPETNQEPVVSKTQSAEDVDPDASGSSDESDVKDNIEPDRPDSVVTSVQTDSKLNSVNKWKNYAFLKPLKILSQLSGYPNLLMLYNIFACLTVSSTSAERALSKLKIIKNRLRSTLADDFLSALMILAAEKDLLHALTDEEIILRVAIASPSLKSQLLYD